MPLECVTNGACTFGKISMLALADSVNPCAIAVLTMVLVSILIENPTKRKNILFAGLAFVSSIFIGYMVYGTIIIQFLRHFLEKIQ